MNDRRAPAIVVAAVALVLFLLGRPVQAQDSGIPSAVTPPGVMATPTIDRLAAPPTVPSPTQADEGAQLFWLYCQPCHGDQGQGLTDEWRSQFPAEEQNCWQSGCHGTHGKDPPEFGFVLPTAVPPVVGAGALARFADAGQLNAFIRAAMPYENPGRLSDEESLAITAFLARAHDRWDGRALTEDTVASISLRAQAAVATPPPPVPSSAERRVSYPLVLALIATVGVGVLLLWRGRRP